ncbi:MAG: tRNA pseudouridine(13) synthase TruD [bacterium]
MYPMFYRAIATESAIELDLEALLDQPYLTQGSPGIGGVAKSVPQDFIVEEIPLYELSGEGEHVWIKIRKTALDAQSLADLVAEKTGVTRHEVGFAGLKDKSAVTTQWFSVHHHTLDPQSLIGPWGESVEVLEATRHTNKLKVGHLVGNRFTLTIRHVDPERIDDGAKIIETIRASGVPNYFGPQRFGSGRRTFWQGWNAITKGQLAPHLRKNKRLRSLSLSAVQSAVFNYIVAQRIAGGTFTSALVGDILEKAEGGLARVDAENQAEWSDAVARGLATPTGPMMASRMLRATDEVADMESRAVALFGLDEAMFERRRGDLRGERRPLSVRVEDLTYDAVQEDVVRVGFSLPSGSYATVLLRELMKNDHYNGPSTESLPAHA